MLDKKQNIGTKCLYQKSRNLSNQKFKLPVQEFGKGRAKQTQRVKEIVDKDKGRSLTLKKKNQEGM